MLCTKGESTWSLRSCHRQAAYVSDLQGTKGTSNATMSWSMLR